LAHVDAPGGGGDHGQHLIPHQGVVDHHVGPVQERLAPEGHQSPVPGARPHQKDLSHHLPSPPSNSCRSLTARARPKPPATPAGPLASPVVYVSSLSL